MDKKSRWLLKLISATIQVSIAMLLSLVITIINAGFVSGFLFQWAKGFDVALVIIPPALRLIPELAWGVAFVKALPVGLFIGFTMTFLVRRGWRSSPWRDGIAGLSMMCMRQRPAAGFARRLMVPVSNDTLLRVVRS